MKLNDQLDKLFEAQDILRRLWANRDDLRRDFYMPYEHLKETDRLLDRFCKELSEIGHRIVKEFKFYEDKKKRIDEELIKSGNLSIPKNEN